MPPVGKAASHTAATAARSARNSPPSTTAAAVVDGGEFRAERAAVAAVWDAAFPTGGTGGV